MWDVMLMCLQLSCKCLATVLFVRTNRRAVAVMFVRPSGMGVHCNHTVHFRADIRLWLDCPVSCAP